MKQRRALSLSSDFLWPAVAISLCIHAIGIYSLWQPLSTKALKQSDPITALINYKSEETALRAQLLAQWSNQGGGDGLPHETASAPFTGDYTPSPNELVLVALRERLQEKEEEQKQRLQQLESAWLIQQNQQDISQSDEIGHHPDTNASALLAKEYHLLKQQLHHYNAQPRIHFDAPSTQASTYAAYIEAWRAKIERIGTEHYPDQAKGQLSDTVQMTVYIDKDGNLLKVSIHQPAQNPLFNVAAQRIIRLAAPFSPFSAEMREQMDVLAITRSWHFTQGNFTSH